MSGAYSGPALSLASDQMPDDSLMGAYMLPDGRVDALMHRSLSPASSNSPSMPPGFANYPLPVHPPPTQATMYDSATTTTVRRQGSVSSLSNGYNSSSTAQRRFSISSTGDPKPVLDGSGAGSVDGVDYNASPGQQGGVDMMGMGTMMDIENPPTAGDTQADDFSDQVDAVWTSKQSSHKDDNPPAWSEMKTKAGKERKRLPLACIACRRKKIRCSGEKPACKHCLRSRIPCVYKVTTRKAAPRTDYMAMLDKRLKRMEDRVIKLIPKEEASSAASVQRAVVKPALPGAAPLPSSGNKKRPAADDAIEAELDDWAKAKPGDPSTTGTSQVEDSTRGLMAEGAESLPSKDLQEHLAEVYFDYVYGQSYPLLHKPRFMSRLAAGTVPPVLVLAVCAVSARFSTHPKLRTDPAFLRGETWASKAREISLRRYDSPNITILIVYLLLGLHEFGTCHGGRSWMFGGMAQRMAFALQLHKYRSHDPSVTKEDDGKPELTFVDREIRRRILWSCFLMDRFNCSGTERPLFMNENYITTRLPINESSYLFEIPGATEDINGGVPPSATDEERLAARNNMGVCAYIIRLVRIWGRIINYINLGGMERDNHVMWAPESTYHALTNQIRHFKQDLPESLHYTPENLQTQAASRTANQFIYLHIFYHQIILFLNRFALPSTSGIRPAKDMPHEFLTESAHAALNSANKISQLISEALDYRVVAPFAGYSAFYSSTVHIYGVFAKNPKQQALSKKYLACNIKYLTQMKKYWGMFHFVTENLKELYRQHSDAALRGTAEGSSSPRTSGIFQYGDWFDRYPYGVSKTDFEGPAHPVKAEPGTETVLSEKTDLQSVEEFFASLSPPSKAEAQRRIASKKTKHSKQPGKDAAAAAAAAALSTVSASHSQPPPTPITAAAAAPSSHIAATSVAPSAASATTNTTTSATSSSSQQADRRGISNAQVLQQQAHAQSAKPGFQRQKTLPHNVPLAPQESKPQHRPHPQLNTLYFNPGAAATVPIPYSPSDFAPMMPGQQPQQQMNMHPGAAMAFTNSPAVTSFPGMHHQATIASPTTPSSLMGANALNSFWNLDPTGMGNAVVADPSGTFFLPFNMEPPPTNPGDDNAAFCGSAWDGGFDMLGHTSHAGMGMDGQQMER